MNGLCTIRNWGAQWFYSRWRPLCSFPKSLLPCLAKQFNSAACCSLPCATLITLLDSCAFYCNFRPLPWTWQFYDMSSMCPENMIAVEKDGPKLRSFQVRRYGCWIPRTYIICSALTRWSVSRGVARGPVIQYVFSDEKILACTHPHLSEKSFVHWVN